MASLPQARQQIEATSWRVASPVRLPSHSDLGTCAKTTAARYARNGGLYCSIFSQFRGLRPDIEREQQGVSVLCEVSLEQLGKPFLTCFLPQRGWHLSSYSVWPIHLGLSVPCLGHS